MSVLNWITGLVKDAVLRGFAEAAAELRLTDADDANGALADLRSKIAALPSPDGEAKVSRKGK